MIPKLPSGCVLAGGSTMSCTSGIGSHTLAKCVGSWESVTSGVGSRTRPAVMKQLWVAGGRQTKGKT